MARFVLAMNVSLDGYVDHDRFSPDPDLFRHWTEQVAASPEAIYGRKIYDLMHYWETDQPGWGKAEHAFATAWRAQHKWVVSTTLEQVGPNATLIRDDIEPTLRALKHRLTGDIDIAGTALAQSIAPLIDEYRLYYHPVVLGHGRPMFPGPLPRLRITAHDRIGPHVVRLTCVPA